MRDRRPPCERCRQNTTSGNGVQHGDARRQRATVTCHVEHIHQWKRKLLQYASGLSINSRGLLTVSSSPNSNGDRPGNEKDIWHARWFQWLLGVIVAVLALSLLLPPILWVVYQTRSAMLPVLIALVLAYITNPLVTWLGRRLRLPRWAGTTLIMLGGLLFVALIALAVVPPMTNQGTNLLIKMRDVYPQQIMQVIDEHLGQPIENAIDSDQPPSDDGHQPLPQGDPDNQQGSATPPMGQGNNIPDAQRDGVIANGNDQTGDNINADSAGDTTRVTAGDDGNQDGRGADQEPGLFERFVNEEHLRQVAQRGVDSLRKLEWPAVGAFILQSLDIGVGMVGSAINFGSYLVLSSLVLAFCFFFFSWRFNEMTAWFVPLIPYARRERTLEVLSKMDVAMAAFVRGRLIQSAIMATTLSIGWWLAGVPYWLLLGVLSGMLNLVPFAASVGWLVALLLAVVDALGSTQGLTMWTVVWPTVVYVIAQGLDGWLIEPVVQGKATDLDPVTVLVAVLVGSSVAGLLGLIIAVPTAACLKILSKEVLLPHLRQLAAAKPTGDKPDS